MPLAPDILQPAQNLLTASPQELDKQRAMDLVKRRYDVARRANTLDYERFARYYKLFRNRQVIKNYLGLANLFVPEPYRIVRKKTAKLARAIQKIKVNAEGEQFVDAARIGSHLMSFLRRKLNWAIQERNAIQESRIIGLSWLKLVWNMGKETIDKPYLGFDLSFHSADEILIEPTSLLSDVYDGTLKWLIHWYEADIETLKKNPNYNPEDIRMLEMRGGNPKTDRTQLEMARINWIHHNKLKDYKTRKYKIYEYWGKYNPKDPEESGGSTGTEEDYLIVIADNSIVLRMEPNPYKDILSFPIPFVPIPANPVGQELYPVGDIEPAESLFMELNDTRNQRMDTVTMNIDPPKEVLRSAGIDEKELVPRRGWYFKTNVPNSVRFIPPNMEGVRAAIEEEKVIRSDIQQVTNILDFNPGSEVAAGVAIDTARGAIIAKGEADVITDDEIELLKVSLRMLYRIALSYAQTFLDRKFTMRVVEQGVESFYNVDRQDIQGNLDLDIEMATLQDQTTEQQLKLMLFHEAKEVPGANIGKFFTDLLESFKDSVNIKEYYQEPQPQPPESPKVSISLKGELNPSETDEIFKTIPNVDAKAADPLMRPETRELMRGNHPEEHDRKMKQMELMEKQANILTQFDKAEQNASAGNGSDAGTQPQ